MPALWDSRGEGSRSEWDFIYCGEKSGIGKRGGLGPGVRLLDWHHVARLVTSSHADMQREEGSEWVGEVSLPPASEPAVPSAVGPVSADPNCAEPVRAQFAHLEQEQVCARDVGSGKKGPGDLEGCQKERRGRDGTRQ